MALEALVCPNCNGEVELDKDQEFGFCKYCGTKVQNTNIKIVKGKVKVDKSNELENYYVIARRALKDGDNEKAEKYYDLILQQEPNSWEAVFYTAWCNAYSCKIMNIGSAAIKVNNSLSSVLKLIKDDLKGKKREEAVKEVILKANEIFLALYNAAKNHYDGINYEIRNNYTQEYLDRAFNCLKGLNYLADLCDLNFSDIESIKEDIGTVYANSNFIHIGLVPLLANKQLNIEEIHERTEKVKKYNPEYIEPQIKTSGCYVATAVYGSYDCPEVWTLRRFRDNYLDDHFFGRLFIKCYYKISPTLVKIFGKNKIFVSINRQILDKWVNLLNERGYENTKYNDKY